MHQLRWATSNVLRGDFLWVVLYCEWEMGVLLLRLNGRPSGQKQVLFRLPRSERLKHPRRSPERESAPHCSTTAPGENVSMILPITGRKMDLKLSSSIPSCRGKLIA